MSRERSEAAYARTNTLRLNALGVITAERDEYHRSRPLLDRETCLIYFRTAISEPLSVPPWSEWWAANEELAAASFPLVDYVRLKHRRLLGAQQILQLSGELPPDFSPQSPLLSGSCCRCGERFVNEPAAEAAGDVKCSACGIKYLFIHGPECE